jgi:uncharacterized membrane protein YccC
MSITDLIDLSDLIGSLIGAVLGFLGAYWILHLQLEAELRKAKESDVDQFKYIVSLVERSIWGWRKHIDDARQFGNNSKDYPLEMHQHPLTVNVAHQTLQRMDRLALRRSAIEALGEEIGEREQREIASFIDAMEAYSKRLELIMVGLKEDHNNLVWQVDGKSRAMILRIGDLLRGVSGTTAQNDPTIQAFGRIHAAAISLVQRGSRPTLEDLIRFMVIEPLELTRRPDVNTDVLNMFLPMIADLDMARQRIEDKGDEIHDRVLELTSGMEDQLERVSAVVGKLKVYQDLP